MIAFAIALMLSAVGCDGSGSGTVPVRGKVTFNGAAPPAGGSVFFTPLEEVEGMPQRPGQGHFSTDGVFQVMSFRPGDGLYPGKYGVSISCMKEPPNELAEMQRYSYVKPGLQLPELVIDSSKPEFVYDIDVPANKMNQPP